MPADMNAKTTFCRACGISSTSSPFLGRVIFLKNRSRLFQLGQGEPSLNKIEDIKRRRKFAHSKLLSLKSKVYEKFLKMEEATYVDGALKKKDKELIATGIAVATNCESCMEWHISEAIKSGATFREVLEAIEVGIEFGAGKATVSARFALEVMDNISKKPKD